MHFKWVNRMSRELFLNTAVREKEQCFKNIRLAETGWGLGFTTQVYHLLYKQLTYLWSFQASFQPVRGEGHSDLGIFPALTFQDVKSSFTYFLHLKISGPIFVAGRGGRFLSRRLGQILPVTFRVFF